MAERRADDAGQRRDVGDLGERGVVAQAGHERVVGEDEAVHAHAAPLVARDPPADLVEPLEANGPTARWGAIGRGVAGAGRSRPGSRSSRRPVAAPRHRQTSR